MKLLLPSLILASLLVLVPTNAEAKTITSETYSFEYPTGCKVEDKPNKYSETTRIECKGDAGFQIETLDLLDMILAGGISNEAIADTIIDLEDKIWTGVSEVDRGNKTVGNESVPYVIFTYDQEFSNLFGATKTENFVGQVVAIPAGDKYVMVTYNNDEDSFDKQLPMAEKIIQSVKGLGNGTGTEIEIDNSFTSEGDDLSKTKALCDTVTTQSAKDLCETLLN